MCVSCGRGNIPVKVSCISCHSEQEFHAHTNNIGFVCHECGGLAQEYRADLLHIHKSCECKCERVHHVRLNKLYQAGLVQKHQNVGRFAFYTLTDRGRSLALRFDS